MGDHQLGVRVQDIQQAVQLIREQDIVVGAKGTIGRFNQGDAEFDFLMDRDRRIIDLMNDVEASPANRLPIFRQGLTRTGI
jgi:hypothetical protein